MVVGLGLTGLCCAPVEVISENQMGSTPLKLNSIFSGWGAAGRRLLERAISEVMRSWVFMRFFVLFLGGDTRSDSRDGVDFGDGGRMVVGVGRMLFLVGRVLFIVEWEVSGGERVLFMAARKVFVGGRMLFIGGRKVSAGERVLFIVGRKVFAGERVSEMWGRDVPTPYWLHFGGGGG